MIKIGPSEFDTIDLHHGSYSADPPYAVVEVFGAPLSENIKTERSEYGLDEFQQNAGSFCALRTKTSKIEHGITRS